MPRPCFLRIDARWGIGKGVDEDIWQSTPWNLQAIRGKALGSGGQAVRSGSETGPLTTQRRSSGLYSYSKEGVSCSFPPSQRWADGRNWPCCTIHHSGLISEDEARQVIRIVDVDGENRCVLRCRRCATEIRQPYLVGSRNQPHHISSPTHPSTTILPRSPSARIEMDHRRGTRT